MFRLPKTYSGFLLVFDILYNIIYTFILFFAKCTFLCTFALYRKVNSFDVVCTARNILAFLFNHFFTILLTITMKYRNGYFTGKGTTAIGRMCAYDLNGANVFRSIPEKVRVSQAENAVSKRKRFAVLSKLIKDLTPIFILRTLPTKAGENYRNPASTANSPAVTDNGQGIVTTDLTALVLSKGSLASQPVTVTPNSSAKNVTITWTASTAVGTSPDDSVKIAVVSDGDGLLVALEEDARAAGTKTIDLSSVPVGANCYVYVFVKSATNGSWSDSIYAGTFVA